MTDTHWADAAFLIVVEAAAVVSCLVIIKHLVLLP